tara:strand:+ start:327 stop:527 length:201 start_codon:yes stop_codon:yes gene_type:complete
MYNILYYNKAEGNLMNTEYAVWVGGTEIGVYASMSQAREVSDEWRDDGYTDVQIEALPKPTKQTRD